MVDPLTIREPEEPLRNPILILAFLGWNDAADSATGAVRHLKRRLRAEPIAEIDAEEFFVFTEQRPEVRFGEGLERVIQWPSTRFAVVRMAQTDRDLVLGLGTEPHLKWRTFAAQTLRVAERLGVREVVTLGAMLADTPHTRPVPVHGGANDPARGAQLGLEPSTYQGPTGIVGAINDVCRTAGVSALSLWASVPHYVSGTPNPRATQALLQRLSDIYDLNLDLRDLEVRARRYETEVTSALEDNPEVQEYVARLEQAHADGEPAIDAEDAVAAEDDTPISEADVLDEVNRLLRGDA